MQCPVCGSGNITIYVNDDGTILHMCPCGAAWTK